MLIKTNKRKRRNYKRKNTERKAEAALKKIITRFKNIGDGFSCGEHDFLGMRSVLDKKENEENLSPEWETALADVSDDIEIVRKFISISY